MPPNDKISSDFCYTKSCLIGESDTVTLKLGVTLVVIMQNYSCKTLQLPVICIHFPIMCNT